MDDLPNTEPEANADSVNSTSTHHEEDATLTPISQTPQTAPTDEQQPRDSHRKRNPFIVGTVVLIVTAAAGCLLYQHHHHKTSSTAHTSTTKRPTTPKTPVTTASYQFYAEPKKLSDLHFFKDTAALFGSQVDSNSHPTGPTIPASQVSYYQIGLTSANQPVVVAADYNAGEGSFAYVAIENTAGHYQLLSKLAGNTLDTADFSKGFANTVSLDKTGTIPAFEFAAPAVVGNSTFAFPPDFSGPHGYFINGLSGLRGSYYGSIPLASSAIKKIGQSGAINYYEVTAEDQPNYKVQEIYGAVKAVYAASYIPVDALNDSSGSGKPQKIVWGNGQINTNTYSYRASGCGSALGYVITKNLDPNQLLKAGVEPDGSTIYQLPATSSLLKAYYTDYGGGQYLQSKNLMNLSVSGYQSIHAVIVKQNALGEYVVYEREDMGPPGGCGKPVIYLYPQKTMSVDVRVGANISSAEPAYTKFGWQDVLASPDGILRYQGKIYNSLYWEGTGLGFYPLIDDGTVVPRSAVVSTIRSQLTAQGLTTKEASDFLTFWQPRLPKNPYVRLTWLNTAQMNELAPLYISPEPQTVIRVFLDFQGLNKPELLPPQTFTTPTRNGFTVVEWGGLLQDLH